MNLFAIDSVLMQINFILEFVSIIFVTFVFFSLMFTDKKIQLSHLSEKFTKFHRYDVFKHSLFFLVITFYFVFFSRIVEFLEFPNLTSTIFTFIANIFLLLFVFELYKLLHKYVPHVDE